MEDDVRESLRIAGVDLACRPDGETPSVREGARRIVATRTGLRAVAGSLNGSQDSLTTVHTSPMRTLVVMG